MVSNTSPLLMLCAALLLHFSAADSLAPTETLNNCRPILIKGDTFGHHEDLDLEFDECVKSLEVQLLDHRVGVVVSGIMVSVCHPTLKDIQVDSDWTKGAREMTLTRAGGDVVDTKLKVAVYLKPFIGPDPVAL